MENPFLSNQGFQPVNKKSHFCTSHRDMKRYWFRLSLELDANPHVCLRRSVHQRMNSWFPIHLPQLETYLVADTNRAP